MQEVLCGTDQTALACMQAVLRACATSCLLQYACICHLTQSLSSCCVLQSDSTSTTPVLLVQAKRLCAQHAAGVEGAEYAGSGTRCSNEACSKSAVFGYPGQRPMYCKTCIPAELQGVLVDVKSKRCEYGGCAVRPNFGFATDRVSAVHHECLPELTSHQC
jgi:hypothetical protein